MSLWIAAAPARACAGAADVAMGVVTLACLYGYHPDDLRNAAVLAVCAFFIFAGGNALASCFAVKSESAAGGMASFTASKPFLMGCAMICIGLLLAMRCGSIPLCMAVLCSCFILLDAAVCQTGASGAVCWGLGRAGAVLLGMSLYPSLGLAGHTPGEIMMPAIAFLYGASLRSAAPSRDGADRVLLVVSWAACAMVCAALACIMPRVTHADAILAGAVAIQGIAALRAWDIPTRRNAWCYVSAGMISLFLVQVSCLAYWTSSMPLNSQMRMLGPLAAFLLPLFWALSEPGPEGALHSRKD